MTIPDISFQDYLEAKTEVDERALNFEVRRHLLSDIGQWAASNRGPLRVLDLGTGTGAMVRRLVRDLGAVRSAGTALEICGIDLDAELIETAGRLRPTDALEEVQDDMDPGSLAVEFRVVSVEKALSEENSRELITAHALMDILPMAATCAAIRRSLVPGALFYATINYNGLTRWYPQAQDAEFERQLLAYYDRSMRRVRDDGSEHDGAASGGRLYEACSAAGLEVLAVGGSDWCVVPKVNFGSGNSGGDSPRGGNSGAGSTPAYTADEVRFLGWMLRTMYQEGRKEFASGPMDSWMSDRLHCLQQATLALVVHNLDVLARRRPN
jgi:SAM-dependent methyltransferase